jgi:hemolysin III
VRLSQSIPACRPFTQPYDRAELLVDGLMHIAGIGLAIVGLTLLTSLASKLPDFQSTSVWIYGIGLVVMFGISGAYNLWPVCTTKLVLRRFDHSMIYLFIAATYTPFIAQAEPSTFTKAILTAVWVVAGVGVILKLVFPGRLERLGVLLCVAMGWSGLLVYDAVFSPLPPSTVGLIVGGGILYSGGIIFHLWERLRFQNAVWHAFVITAAVFQFIAVFNSVSTAASTGG